MKSDGIVTEETIARPREGVIVPIKYTGAPIKDAKGNIKGALEFILDITEEARQRHDANTKIENLNAIPTPIMSIDTDYAITFINPAGAAAVGLTPDSAIGRKCFDLFKTPHCQTEKCACNRAMKTDSVVSDETIARPRDGMIMPIKYTGAPIKDAKGNITGALEFVLDITDEARQRQEANEKIENLNAIPTPIFSIDTDFSITFINPAGGSGPGFARGRIDRQEVLQPVQQRPLPDRTLCLQSGHADGSGYLRQDGCPYQRTRGSNQIHRCADQGCQGQYQGGPGVCP